MPRNHRRLLDGMVNVKGKMCRTEGCGTQPSFGVAGTKTAEYCKQHALDGNGKNCGTEGCGKIAAFGVAGTKAIEYCRQHALEGWSRQEKKMLCRRLRQYHGHTLSGMVNVRNVMCRLEGCGKIAAFGVAGTKTSECRTDCRQHATGRSDWKVRKRRSTAHSTYWMVNVRGTMCGTKGCGKRPSFGRSRYENGGILHTACTGRDGQRPQKSENRSTADIKDSSMISAFKVADMKRGRALCAGQNTKMRYRRM